MYAMEVSMFLYSLYCALLPGADLHPEVSQTLIPYRHMMSESASGKTYIKYKTSLICISL